MRKAAVLASVWITVFTIDQLLEGIGVDIIRGLLAVIVFSYLWTFEDRIKKLELAMKGNRDTLKVIGMIAEQEQRRYNERLQQEFAQLHRLQGAAQVSKIKLYADTGKSDTLH